MTSPGWVGEFRTPTLAAFVFCFHPWEEGSRMAEQGAALVFGSWGGTKANAQQRCSVQGCSGDTQGDTRQGTRCDLPWLGTTAVLSWCAGPSSYCRGLSVCLQKGRSWAEEKEKLPFSAAEGCTGYPAKEKLNFQRRGQWKRMMAHNGVRVHGQLL